MIKKILDWILGKNDSASSSAAQESAAVPYKVEAPAVVEVAPAAAPIEVPPTPVAEDLPVVETAPVTVKAKYKKAELNKKTKKELLELAAQHGLEVKSRATKEELVKVLAKV